MSKYVSFYMTVIMNNLKESRRWHRKNNYECLTQTPEDGITEF